MVNLNNFELIQCLKMEEDDIISLSSSSRPSSPFINASEVFNDSEKHETLNFNISHDQKSPQKHKTVHYLSDSDDCSINDEHDVTKKNKEVLNFAHEKKNEGTSSSQDSIMDSQHCQQFSLLNVSNGMTLLTP